MKKIIVLIIALASVAFAADKPDCYQIKSTKCFTNKGFCAMEFGCLKPDDNVDVGRIGITYTLEDSKLLVFTYNEYRTDSTMRTLSKTSLTYARQIDDITGEFDDNKTHIMVEVYDDFGVRTNFVEWSDARPIEHHYAELRAKYNFITKD